jgi:hypothetical protein
VLPNGLLALPEAKSDGGATAIEDRYRIPLSAGLSYDIDLPHGTKANGGGLYLVAEKSIVKVEAAGEGDRDAARPPDGANGGSRRTVARPRDGVRGLMRVLACDRSSVELSGSRHARADANWWRPTRGPRRAPRGCTPKGVSSA